MPTLIMTNVEGNREVEDRISNLMYRAIKNQIHVPELQFPSHDPQRSAGKIQNNTGKNLAPEKMKLKQFAVHESKVHK